MRAAAAIFIVLLAPVPALAYRPFDSTDAAVADPGAFEIEVSPLSYRHDNDGTAWIAPSARFNYAFSQNWEVVLEGEADHFAHGPSQLTEAALSLKTVLRNGSLQEASGWSFASEASLLLPGIGAENEAGLEWTGIASQRFEWGTVHFNIAALLTREQRSGVFTGLVLEGPSNLPVRPVAEFNYEREFGIGDEYSGLIGAIWRVSVHMAFDLAYRHAETDNRPDDQVRFGVTFDL